MYIGLTHQPDSGTGAELRIFLSDFPKHLPEFVRIAVGSEHSRMHNIEQFSILFTIVFFGHIKLLYGIVHILLIVSVGYEFDRRRGHFPEIFLHHRGDRNDEIGIVQHLLFQLLVHSAGEGCKFQVLEIEHLGPRVAEVYNPRNPHIERDFPGNQMH